MYVCVWKRERKCLCEKEQPNIKGQIFWTYFPFCLTYILISFYRRWKSKVLFPSFKCEYWRLSLRELFSNYFLKPYNYKIILMTAIQFLSFSDKWSKNQSYKIAILWDSSQILDQCFSIGVPLNYFKCAVISKKS